MSDTSINASEEGVAWPLFMAIFSIGLTVLGFAYFGTAAAAGGVLLTLLQLFRLRTAVKKRRLFNRLKKHPDILKIYLSQNRDG